MILWELDGLEGFVLLGISMGCHNRLFWRMVLMMKSWWLSRDMSWMRLGRIVICIHHPSYKTVRVLLADSVGTDEITVCVGAYVHFDIDGFIPEDIHCLNDTGLRI